MFVATIGFGIGLDTALFRKAAALLLIAAGLVLMVPRLQVAFAGMRGPVGGWAGNRFGGFSNDWPSGQLKLGLLLGARFGVQVSPTPGAARPCSRRKGTDLRGITLT